MSSPLSGSMAERRSGQQSELLLDLVWRPGDGMDPHQGTSLHNIVVQHIVQHVVHIFARNYVIYLFC